MRELRRKATPLVTGAGLLTFSTGFLMFFHVRRGLVEPIHIWSGVLLLAAVVLHLVVNWKPLLHALQSRWALAVVGLFAMTAVVAALPLGGQRHGEGSHALAVQALLDAPLPAVAAVAKRTPEDVSAALSDGGVRLPAPARSLREVASVNRRPPEQLLELVLGGR